MKSLKQILKECSTLDIRETEKNSFLIDLVRAGLLEEGKLSLVERALSIDAELMTDAEKKALSDLLENVSEYMLYEAADDDKKIKTKEKPELVDKKSQPPLVIYFQRRSMKKFPQDINVAVYYSKQLDKYISIPFGPKAAEYLPQTVNENYVPSQASLSAKIKNNPKKRKPRGNDEKREAARAARETSRNIRSSMGSNAAKVFNKVRKNAENNSVKDEFRQMVTSTRNRAAAGDWTGVGQNLAKNTANAGLAGFVGTGVAAAVGRLQRNRLTTEKVDRILEGKLVSAKKSRSGGSGSLLASILGGSKKTKSKRPLRSVKSSLKKKAEPKTFDQEVDAGVRRRQVKDAIEQRLIDIKKKESEERKKTRIGSSDKKMKDAAYGAAAHAAAATHDNTRRHEYVDQLRHLSGGNIKKAAKDLKTIRNAVKKNKKKKHPSRKPPPADANLKRGQKPAAVKPRYIDTDPNTKKKFAVYESSFRKNVRILREQVPADVPDQGLKKLFIPGVGTAEHATNAVRRYQRGDKKGALISGAKAAGYLASDAAIPLRLAFKGGKALLKGGKSALNLYRARKVAKAAKIAKATAGAKIAQGMTKAGKTASVAKKASIVKPALKATGIGGALGALGAGAKGILSGAAALAGAALSQGGNDNRPSLRHKSSATPRDIGVKRQKTLGSAVEKAQSRVAVNSGGYNRIDESTISVLKNMIKNEETQKEIIFPDNSVTINSRIARKVVSVYESLNKNNKKDMENMLNESISSFRKVINFAIKAQNGK